MSVYTPAGTVQDPVVNAELMRIAEVLNEIDAGIYTTHYEEPEKPREGMVKKADGTDWNPGEGAGLYYHNGTSWILLSETDSVDESWAYFLDF